jgi:hypothetical protein
MSLRIPGSLLGAALGLSIVASPAWAQRDIAIDGDPSGSITACHIDVACSGVTLPFSIVTPAVTTNRIFIYDSGIVALGSQLSLSATYGDVSSLGHGFLAPGFADFEANTPTVYITNVSQKFGGLTGEYRVTWAFPNSTGPIFQLSLTDLSLIGPVIDQSQQGFHFFHDPNLVGDVAANFYYGSAFGSWNGLPVQLAAGLPQGAIVGWGVGALDDTGTFAGNFSGLPSGVNLTDAAAFVAKPAVPEPAAWILMLAGFASIGVSLRKVRFGGVAQPS